MGWGCPLRVARSGGLWHRGGRKASKLFRRGGPAMSQGRPAENDLGRFCCLNAQCPDYGKRGAGNLTVPMRYGRHRRRLLRCRTCKARFSERKGTALFDSRLAPEKAVAV